VAGVARPRVDLPNGEAYVATVVHFDPTNDLAIVRVPGLGSWPLPLADPDRSTAVALVGYPENGPLRRTPGRLGGTRKILSRDAYGEGPIRREVTTIRGLVRPGLSGGPGIDAEGRVRTTVFARRAGERGGYGIPVDLVREALRDVGRRPVAATECTR
jgi:S1-C subfamily serine protease